MLQGVESGDMRALHQTRVASRRLREVLPALELDPDVTRKLSRRLRKVTQRLGSVRELDVLLMLVEELHQTGNHDRRALTKLAGTISDDRTRARERLLEKLPTAELQRIAAKLAKIANAIKTGRDRSKGQRSAPREWPWTTEARLARRASALKRAVHDAGAVYLADRLHVARIALKKLRYALEVSEEIAGLKTSPDLRTLKRAQDILGRVHDVQTLIDRIRQLQASLTPPDVTLWRELDSLVTALDNSCRRLHGRFMHERPAILAICDLVGAKPPASAARRAAS